MLQKISTNIRMGFKILCQVEDFVYFFQNYPMYVCFKNELLHPQKEKSRTCSNFEIFDHDLQLDIKFWNP